MRDDRTVHGRTLRGQEIVRYDISGKWYLENSHGRFPVKVRDAARLAVAGVAYLGKPGGQRFDSEVRRLQKKPKTQSVTTSTGTTVRIEEHVGSSLVMLSNPKAPAGMRDIEAGRLIDSGFQPAPFAAFGISPETLRAIATLIEENQK